MSKLRSVADYEREIAGLDAMIKREHRLNEVEYDAAADLSLHSLVQRREALAAELRMLGDERMPGHELDVIFSGEPVRGHSLDAEFMGKVLLKIQNLVRAMVAAEDHSTAQSGSFSDDVRRVARLQFAESFAGSFGMRLEAFQEQYELDGRIPLAPTLSSLIELLEAGDSPEPVLLHLAELGQRASKHYEELVEELSKGAADMRLIWPNVSGQREANLRQSQATKLLGTLREVREETDGRFYTGFLDVANKRHGRFGFQTDDGYFFDGVVEGHLLPYLREFYDRHCRAFITTRVVRHQRTGIEKRSHRLQELQSVPDTPET